MHYFFHGFFYLFLSQSVDWFSLTFSYPAITIESIRKQRRFAMLYVHYCITCDKIHILNGHKKRCPACGKKLHELKLTFLQYSALDDTDRQTMLMRIHDRLSDGADTPQAQ